MSARGCVVPVVDDEPAVLATLAHRLRRAGCEVLGAGGGPEALRILASRSDVALILSDCNMVPMSGPELARIVLERWPSMTFVAMSGRLPEGDLPEAVRFIPKPIRPPDLIALVESARG